MGLSVVRAESGEYSHRRTERVAACPAGWPGPAAVSGAAPRTVRRHVLRPGAACRRRTWRGTDLDASTHPPGVSMVEYLLDTPDADDLIESFPVFLVSTLLGKALVDASLGKSPRHPPSHDTAQIAACQDVQVPRQRFGVRRARRARMLDGLARGNRTSRLSPARRQSATMTIRLSAELNLLATGCVVG
jgi:hypothetical protein